MQVRLSSGVVGHHLVCGASRPHKSLGRLSPHTIHFTIPSLVHVLQSTDLRAWSCNKAARLLESSVPTMWVYTDGSSSPQCHVSAVIFFPPQGVPTILSCSSPYESSQESEGWAVRVALQRLLQDPPRLRVCFLIDNDQIQSKLAHFIRLSRSNNPPLPPRVPASGSGFSWAC